MEEQIKFLEEHCKFNEPTDCYVILAVSRKKDTEELTQSTEIVFREVITSKEEIARKYLKIKASVTNYKSEEGKSYPFYIYISLNPLNGRKAAIKLTTQIFKWLEREQYDKPIVEKYKRTYAEFYSCLMSPDCRGSEKFYMIDFDSKDEEQLYKLIHVLNENTKDILIKETRNGYHIKFKPMDVRKIPQSEFYTLKKDCLFFTEFVPNGS